ncbi:NAD(P)-binding domain protein [Niveomyces insectorum RCEF 264]|uniref:NAD(P)-binding domain protein n=1 Tax=Niveomyces insectorum RCEF 264 TaxID=1081102 RepID=A0A168AC20_9HYPO|nr:NAD(P)-binding domain protein [Niveomyces insectorum RCEF 264]
MGSTDSPTELPQALMLGEIQHAKDVFTALQKVFRVRQITHGDRSQFLADCESGIYDDIVAIGRTVDSVQFTGLFDAELVSRLPSSVKFICHNGAGYDQVDVQTCISRGIAVSNTPSVVNAATADTTLLLLLAALRRARIPQTALLQGLWSTTTPLGRDPAGLKLGILGLGGIGAAVAQRAAAFDIKLQYHNRRPAAASVLDNLQSLGVDIQYVSFDELLATSDIISVHVPLSAATRHLIGEKEIARMKDGVVLINTARGPVVDEDALVAGLSSGKIWSAGLDVFEREPDVHPGLLANENAVLLPHIGTATVDTRKRMEEVMLENVQSALTQRRLVTPVPECTQ